MIPAVRPSVTSTTSRTEPVKLGVSTIIPAVAGLEEPRTSAPVAFCWKSERCRAVGAVKGVARTAGNRVVTWVTRWKVSGPHGAG